MNTKVTIPNKLILAYADRVGYSYPYVSDEEGNQIEVSEEEIEEHKLQFGKDALFKLTVNTVVKPAINDIKRAKIAEANTEAEAFKSQVESQITVE